jgi:hypothetical protein
MAVHREDEQPRSRQVRRSVILDATKLDHARQALGAASDAEVLRIALDHLVSHFPAPHDEEE